MKTAKDALPGGVITALFTDIVDSTGLKRLMQGETTAHRDEAFREEIKKPHDAIVNERVDARRGRVVKSTGDGFLVVFRDPEEALLCALEIQEEIAIRAIATPRGRLQLRVGLHTGIAEPSDGDIFSSAIDKAARVQVQAGVDQVLISEETFVLVRGKVPGIEFASVGSVELKGIGPTTLFTAFRPEKDPLPQTDVQHRLHIASPSFADTDFAAAEASKLIDVEVVADPTSMHFSQIMALHEKRFGSYDILMPSQFARLLRSQAPEAEWIDRLVAAMQQGRVVATMAIDYSRTKRMGLLSYAARGKQTPGFGLFWTTRLAQRIQSMLAEEDGLRGCTALLLEFDDPGPLNDPGKRRRALARIKLYGGAVEAVRSSGWTLRVLDWPLVTPHQSYCPAGEEIGGEDPTLLGIFWPESAETMSRDRALELISFLWKDLYVHRFGGTPDEVRRYAKYITNLFDDLSGKLNDSVGLLSCERFCSQAQI